MIVRLTARQIEVVRTAFENSSKAWATAWLDVEVLPGHKLTFDVDMPAVGWLHSLQHLLEMTTGPLGGNKRGVAYSALAARRRIASALHLYAQHPALFGMSVYGKSAEVIPAWKLNGAEKPARLFDIFPVVGARFVHLIPEPVGTLTRWNAMNVLPLEDPSFSSLQEINHLRFAPGAQLDAQASGQPG